MKYNYGFTDPGLKINQSNLSPLYGDPGNDLKIGNVAQLDPKVEKKARKIKLNFANKRITNQALQDPTISPDTINSLSKQLGISSQEVIKNKDSLWGILFGGK